MYWHESFEPKHRGPSVDVVLVVVIVVTVVIVAGVVLWTTR